MTTARGQRVAGADVAERPDADQEVADVSELVAKRAYVLRSPEGDELLSTYGGPGDEAGSAVFFAHSPDRDGELTITPGDGWSVLRSVAEDA